MADEEHLKTQDRMHDALATVVREDENAMISKWVCVMEVIGEDGKPQPWSMNSEGLAMWDQMGMLSFRKRMLDVCVEGEQDG